MTMVLFDTNILLDHLLGFQVALHEIVAYDNAAISSVTWIELACKVTDNERKDFEEFIEHVGIKIVHMNGDIMRRAMKLRARSLVALPKIKVLDCIIRATAEAEGRIVVTRNPGDFGGASLAVRVPYNLEEVTDPASGKKIVIVTNRRAFLP